MCEAPIGHPAECRRSPETEVSECDLTPERIGTDPVRTDPIRTDPIRTECRTRPT